MSKKIEVPTLTSEQTPLVERSAVPANLPYLQYRSYLRRDFVYSCAYCTMMESEATAIGFTIDHYEPQRARPDLTNEYSNLMHCCEWCNTYKGDRIPSDRARSNGIRFFRPDTDHRSEHFELNGIRIESKTEIAKFTILAASLNRAQLRKLREIRKKIVECDRRVAEGIMALRNFPIDKLPPDIKGKAAAAISRATNTASAIEGDIEQLLETHARSPLDVDEPADQAASEAKQRSLDLKAYEGLYPGQWRARKKF